VAPPLLRVFVLGEEYDTYTIESMHSIGAWILEIGAYIHHISLAILLLLGNQIAARDYSLLS